MYQYFISLGFYCGISAAMDKYFLRSASGPFDWCFSEFAGVIKLIETNFESFLEKKNLQVSSKNHLEFEDMSYQLYFNHEVTYNFEEEYPFIYEKYQKRIAKFCEMSKHRCCFIRCVRHLEEARYISEHYEDILQIIRKNNSNSDILYIYNQTIENQINQKKILNFFLINKYSGNSIEELRNTFEDNRKLIDLLKSKASPVMLKDNEIFDLKKQLEAKTKQYACLQKQYEIVLQLTNWEGMLDFCLRCKHKVVIYGSGAIGKLFYDKILDHIKPIFFVDEYTLEKEYQAVPIIRLKELENLSEKTVMVVTAMVEQELFREQMKCINCELEILFLKEIITS